MSTATFPFPDALRNIGTAPPSIPTQWDLPCEDDAIENSIDLDQSALLKFSVWDYLTQMFPGDTVSATHDMGIYWSFANRVARVIVPDFSLVPDVPQWPEGKARRSYVMWKETIRPAVCLEYVSGNGSEERDRTPNEGKFWIYEHAV